MDDDGHIVDVNEAFTKNIEGLGVFLAKQIIDVHNGRVWIKSRLNEGSVFSFSIPL